MSYRRVRSGSNARYDGDQPARRERRHLNEQEASQTRPRLYAEEESLPPLQTTRSRSDRGDRDRSYQTVSPVDASRRGPTTREASPPEQPMQRVPDSYREERRPSAQNPQGFEQPRVSATRMAPSETGSMQQIRVNQSYDVPTSLGSRDMQTQANTDELVSRMQSVRVQHDSPSMTTRTLSTTASNTASLLALDRTVLDFVRHRLGDFKSCLTAMTNSPSILKTDQKLLQAAAMVAYQNKDSKLGDQIVERLIILYHCQTNELNVRESYRYISALDHKGKDRRFEEKYQTIRAHLIRQAPTYQASATTGQTQQTAARISSQPPAAAPLSMTGAARQTTYRVMDPGTGSVPSRMSEMSISRDQMTSDSRMTTGQYTGGGKPRGLSQTSSGFHEPHAQDETFQTSIRNQREQRENSSYMSAPPISNPAFQAGANNPYLPAPDNPAPTVVSGYSTSLPAVRQVPTYTQSQTGMTTQPRIPRTSMTSNPPTTSVSDKALESFTIGGRTHAEYQPKNTYQGDTAEGQYAPRVQDAKNFFARGRVFKMWWYSPAGKHTKRDHGIIGTEDGRKIHSKQIYMVVIHSKKGYAICCPISTYSDQGLKKSGMGMDQCMAHAIIYSEGQLPRTLPQEPNPIKEPIKVKNASSVPPLHPASRVHFGMSHTVHWDASILDVGRVVAEDRDYLSQYFVMEHAGRHS